MIEVAAYWRRLRSCWLNPTGRMPTRLIVEFGYVRVCWVIRRPIRRPDVPSLPEPSSDAKTSGPVSVKQRLDLHLKTGTTCYDCHKDIDPWGIATEGFDAVGLPRTTIQKAGPVVKKVVIDEQEIDGLLPLKHFLLEQRHGQFAYGFTRHMLSYALGRPLTFRDDPIVRELQSEFEKSGCNMRGLIKAIATSTVYRQGSQSKPPKSFSRQRQ